MNPVSLVILAVLCNASAQLALKQGALQDISRWQDWLNPGLCLGATLYLVSFILTVRVYAVYPLGVISPLMAGAIFVLINIFAALLFGEAITLQKFLGITLVLAGIGLLAHTTT